MAGVVTRGVMALIITWAGWENTVVVTELVLLLGLGSMVSEVTLAVFVILPATVGALMVTRIVWVRPAGMEAVVAVTTPFACVTVQPVLQPLTEVAPDCIVSVDTTISAVAWP